MNWDKYSSDEERSEKDKASNAKQKQKEDDVSEYTDKEVEYIDRYLPMAKNALDESELYDLIIEYKFNDARIEEEIKHRLKLIEAKGDDYGWTEVKKKTKKAPNQKMEKTNKDIKQKKNYKKDNTNEYNKKKNYTVEKQNDNKEEGKKEEDNNYSNGYYNNKPYYNNYNRRYNNANYRNNYNNNYYNNNGYTKQYNNNYNNNYNSRYYNNNNRNYNNNYNRYNNNTNRYHNNYNNYYNNKQRKEEVEITDLPPQEDNQNTIKGEVAQIEKLQPSEVVTTPNTPPQEEAPKVAEPISPQSSYTYIDISNAALFSIEPTKNAKQVSDDQKSSTSTVKITGDPKPDVNQLYMDYNYNIMNNYYQYMNPNMYYQYQLSQGRGMHDYYGYPNMNYMMYTQMMNQQKYGSSYYQPKKNVPSKTVYHQDSATKEPEKK